MCVWGVAKTRSAGGGGVVTINHSSIGILTISPTLCNENIYFVIRRMYAAKVVWVWRWKECPCISGLTVRVFFVAWLIASESEARTLSRSNSRRQPRVSRSTSNTADYIPILRKNGSLSSQSSLDQEAPAHASSSVPPLNASAIPEVPENEANGTRNNNNTPPDTLPMKTYGTTANQGNTSLN